MPEKIAIITGGIMAFFTAALGVVGRLTFVRKSQVFAKDGKSHFQYADTCAAIQQKCADRTCAKINELKVGQNRVWEKLESMNETLVRIDQKVVDHDQSHKNK